MNTGRFSGFSLPSLQVFTCSLGIEEIKQIPVKAAARITKIAVQQLLVFILSSFSIFEPPRSCPLNCFCYLLLLMGLFPCFLINELMLWYFICENPKV